MALADPSAAASPPPDTVAVRHDAPEATTWQRSPEDLLRLVLSSVAAIAVVLVLKLLADAVGGFSTGWVDLLAVRSEELVRVLAALAQLTYAVVLVFTVAVPLVTRRLRLLAYVLTADLLATLLMALADHWIGMDAVSNAVAVRAGLRPDTLPEATTVAQVAATVVVFGPFVGRRWNRVLHIVFGVLVVLQVLVSVHSPAATLLALVVGPAVGSLVLLAYRRPAHRPTVPQVAAALGASGLEVAALSPADVDARGSTPYMVELGDGTPLFAKVLGSDERAADLLFRTYRRLRLRNVGDERPDSSLRRTVEHEAMVALKARDVGVRTPRLRAMATVGQDGFLLAYDLIPGRSIDSVPDERLTDEVLRGIWAEVAVLRRNRIAHRDLRLANVFLDDEERPWIIDFGFAEVAADDVLLRADVAQLLASLAVAVGEVRAVSTAIHELGADAVGAALGRLQLVALSGATRSAMRERPGLLEELRAEVARRCGIDEPVLDPLSRFRPSNRAVLALCALAVFVGLPLLAGLSAVGDVLSAAPGEGLVGLLVAAVGAEVAAVWALSSSVPTALPAGPLAMASLSSTFASTAAPSRLGGDALVVRFMERHGTERDDARAAVSLGHGVAAVVTLGLLVAFAVWATGNALDPDDVRRPLALVQGVLVLAVLALASFLVPALRRRVMAAQRARRAEITHGLRALAGAPGRVASLVAASALRSLLLVAALHAAAEAIGVQFDISGVGLVLLGGSVLASVVPTPGRLVAIEVILVAGFVSAGIGFAAAVVTVLTYRLATFWLPFLAGWPALGWLRSQGHV